MNLAPYRAVLSRPGVPSLLTLAVLARMPIVAAPIVLALHVVLDMDRGFASSGTVAASIAIGAAIGSPLMGKAMDHLGLRPVITVAVIAETSFWLIAVHLSYVPLVLGAFVGGLVAIPIHSLPRQSLAAMLPPHLRQAGFSLDAMLVEVSFAVGPALGIVLLTQAGSTITLFAIAMLILTSGVAVLILNPPIRSHDDDIDAADGTGVRSDAPSARVWSAPVVAVLLVSATSTVILAGTDTALTAVMRDLDQIALIGPVFAVWCLASLVGGFIYGMSRPVHPMTLLAALGALCIPVMFATSWWTLALLLIPTGLFCAPVISATAQTLTRITPASKRGQVMGLHGSALILGTAAGAPVTGLVVDHVEPRLGFLAIGSLGVAVTLILVPIVRGRIPVHDDAVPPVAVPPVAGTGAAGTGAAGTDAVSAGRPAEIADIASS